ncbi:MAG: hypothetical protein ACOYU7_02335 [Bacillota bacterium]|uniref:hypothetical protein n=1 Tax=Desulforudis sp. DRI-14 TaxID=3459793 RepID=UPI00348A2A29
MLVDEGQDLDSDAFELLRLIAKHITVCLDNKQQIYEKGLHEADILRKLGIRKRNVQLLEAFRCCPYIINVAAEFIEDARQKEEFIRQGKTPAEKETPILYYASSMENEKRRLMEVLSTRQSRMERIAILFPKKNQVYGFAASLRRGGF